MHPLWQLKAKIGIHYERYATFSGLAVDSYNRLIFPSQIGRIDWQIWHLPNLAVLLSHSLHTLVDRILVRSGKGGKYQLSGIWVANMNRNLCTTLADLNHFIDIFQVQFRIDALRKHIVGNRRNIYVSGTLPISKQSSFDPIAASQKR